MQRRQHFFISLFLDVQMVCAWHTLARSEDLVFKALAGADVEMTDYSLILIYFM